MPQKLANFRNQHNLHKVVESFKKLSIVALIGALLLVALDLLASPMAVFAQVQQQAQATEIPLPFPGLTPGDVDPTLTKELLCSSSFHTGSARNVTEKEKKEVCLAYNITVGCPGAGYELDHLVSIELGGSNSIKNLWPQPVDSPTVIGYHTKDVVENRAHAAVCSGKITLQQAQTGIASNWYQFGLDNGFLLREK